MHHAGYGGLRIQARRGVLRLSKCAVCAGERTILASAKHVNAEPSHTSFESPMPGGCQSLFSNPPAGERHAASSSYLLTARAHGDP
ncbi:hypothetical protein ACRALDRAFT_2043310 [Sodiomyces alcalophilus JCM 7366]|uniref:uncharacterized protein n=1 Tax=Sodiomyces alcalophilus JCM 7366 TaxID=591952 RepID=UPI0039B54D5C